MSQTVQPQGKDAPKMPSVAEMERRAFEWARKYPEAFAELGRT